jgi:hypothetical protein
VKAGGHFYWGYSEVLCYKGSIKGGKGGSNDLDKSSVARRDSIYALYDRVAGLDYG